MKISTKIIVPFLILLLAFILRLFVLIENGLDYTLNSDDMGYVSSAKKLINSGMFTYHYEGIPSVHLMPGEPFLLAVIFQLFGMDLGIWIARLLHIIIGCATIFAGMKLASLWVGQKWSWLLGISVAIFPPIIQVDNLLLTEGIYTLATILLIYGTIKLAEKRTTGWYVFVMAVYFLGLFFRVNIALYPLILFLYLVIKKYPWNLFKKQILISIITLLVVMGPWWIRNYLVFDQFIPLTGGSGDPLLLGTFQGEGYPEGSYKETIVMTDSKYVETDILGRMHERQLEARERMKEWWNTDPLSMIKSYFIIKPYIYLKDVFYWKPVFDIQYNIVLKWYQIIVLGGLAGWLCMGLMKKYRAEMFLITGYILMNVVLNSYYFAFPRYNYPLLILWMIGAVFFLRLIINILCSRRKMA